MRAAAFAAVVALPVLVLASAAAPTRADHLMCDARVERRTQTVSIDPDLSGTGLTREDVLDAMRPWNDLFVRYHGFPIFAEHYGEWWEADILLTAHGWPRTWVFTRCSPDYVWRGSNHSIVFIGSYDAWRNRQVLAHELGHALGFADHGTTAQKTDGHLGFAPCSNRYLGVMSYCTSPQAWFLDYSLVGVTLDGQMVQRYWQQP